MGAARPQGNRNADAIIGRFNAAVDIYRKAELTRKPASHPQVTINPSNTFLTTSSHQAATQLLKNAPANLQPAIRDMIQSMSQSFQQWMGGKRFDKADWEKNFRIPKMQAVAPDIAADKDLQAAIDQIRTQFIYNDLEQTRQSINNQRSLKNSLADKLWHPNAIKQNMWEPVPNMNPDILTPSNASSNVSLGITTQKLVDSGYFRRPGSDFIQHWKEDGAVDSFLSVEPDSNAFFALKMVGNVTLMAITIAALPAIVPLYLIKEGIKAVTGVDLMPFPIVPEEGDYFAKNRFKSDIKERFEAVGYRNEMNGRYADSGIGHKPVIYSLPVAQGLHRNQVTELKTSLNVIKDMLKTRQKTGKGVIVDFALDQMTKDLIVQEQRSHVIGNKEKNSIFAQIEEIHQLYQSLVKNEALQTFTAQATTAPSVTNTSTPPAPSAPPSPSAASTDSALSEGDSEPPSPLGGLEHDVPEVSDGEKKSPRM
jgi:hypothetical protein